MIFPSRSTARKQIVVLLGLLLGTTMVGPRGEATAQTVSVRGNVGASFFRAPDLTREVLHSGSNVGAEVGIQVYRGLEVTVGGGYNGFTLNEETAVLRGVGGGDVAFLGGGIGVRYTVENATDAHPYVAIGGGVYQRRRTNRRTVTNDGDLVPVKEDRKTSLEEGAHFAVGSLFRIDETYSVFVEPRYMMFDVSDGFGQSTRYVTLRLGVEMRL